MVNSLYTYKRRDKIIVCYSNEGYNMKYEHYHNFYEIYIYLGDYSQYFVKSKRYKLNYGDILFIDKNVYHRSNYMESKSKERIWIGFYEKLFETLQMNEIKDQVMSLFKGCFYYIPDKYKIEFINNIKEKIFYKYTTGKRLDNIYAHMEFVKFILEFIEKKNNGYITEKENVTGIKEKRIGNIISFLEENYNQSITIDNLCSRFYISRYYLCHSFKEITGISIIKYLIQKRIMEAKKLLILSNMTITQICYSVGIGNLNNFIRYFKELNGLTPGEFRAKYYFKE